MRIWALCLLASVVVSPPSFAAPVGDPAKGKTLAEHWCSSCHLVSPEQTTATTEAPPFATIAERPPEELAELQAKLAAPHPPMPQLNLTRDEIRDLTAYIVSLKGTN